jgi:hypothetical protein
MVWALTDSEEDVDHLLDPLHAPGVRPWRADRRDEDAVGSARQQPLNRANGFANNDPGPPRTWLE